MKKFLSVLALFCFLLTLARAEQIFDSVTIEGTLAFPSKSPNTILFLDSVAEVKAVASTAAISALLPSQSGNSGKVLGTDGSDLSWVTGGSGGGSVFSVNGRTGDVVVTANELLPVQTGNAGKVLLTDGSTTAWVVQSASGSVFSVNGKTGDVFLNTDDIPQGAANIYYTDTVARLALSSSTPIIYDSLTGTLALTTVPIAKGGTGQITAVGAINALAPSQTGNSGKILSTNGTSILWDSLLADSPLLYNSLTKTFSIPQASSLQSGFLGAADWTTFNNKLDASRFNYITNSVADVDTAGWNLYDNAGRTDPAFYVDQDITWTAVAPGNAGNGINVQYVFTTTPGCVSATPCVTVVSPVLVTVGWYNGPTIANNPTATQLKAAWDAVPGAIALATATISGNAGDIQYLNGNHVLANGGDTAPINGTGGVPTGLTFTRSTSGPLVGIANFLLSKDATSQMGSGVSTDFTVNGADKGNPLQISFYYSASAGAVLGSASDTRVFLYDVTNAVMLPITPLKTLTGPTAGSIYRFAGQFTAAVDSVNYRLIFHTATSSAIAWDLKLDEVTVSSVLDAATATEVPKLVISAQPITGAVTDHMAVMWQDGNTSWRPATMASGAQNTNLYGFAVNIVGLTADIVLRGELDGFSVGPFLGYNQYVDNTAGGISPLPSPFTDTGVVMGKGITEDKMLVNPIPFTRLVTSKGGLLGNAGANNGTGDQVLSVGTNGNALIANSAASLGLQWLPAVVATAPLVYTTATRALTCTAATASVAGCLAAADFTTFNAKAATASPTFTGTPTLPTGTIAVTQTPGNNTTAVATTAFVTAAAALKANLASPTFTGTPTMPTGTIGVTQTAGNSTTALATTAFTTTADNLKANIAAPTLTGDVTLSTGNLLVTTIGKGIQVKTGTNAKIGTAVLVGGTVTVANTSVTANSRIFVTSNTDGGTPGWLRVSAKVNATSFTITSSSVLDTSTVAWYIVESIP